MSFSLLVTSLSILLTNMFNHPCLDLGFTLIREGMCSDTFVCEAQWLLQSNFLPVSSVQHFEFMWKELQEQNTGNLYRGGN